MFGVQRPRDRVLTLGDLGAVEVRTPGGGAAWTPALPTTGGGVLPDHWYRSDGPLWQDAGITPAVANGAVVGRWEDKTANADHVNQAVAGSKPTLQNGVGDLLNGHAVIRADGVDYLQGAFTTGGALTQPFTVFAVARLDASVVNDHITRQLVQGDDATHRGTLVQLAGATDTWAIGGSGSLRGAASDGNWNIWSALFNDPASAFWIAGILQNSGVANNEAWDGLTVFARWDGVVAWKGDAVEIIVYDANLSNADKNQVGNYLASRYGLAYTNI